VHYIVLVQDCISHLTECLDENRVYLSFSCMHLCPQAIDRMIKVPKLQGSTGEYMGMTVLLLLLLSTMHSMSEEISRWKKVLHFQKDVYRCSMLPERSLK